MFDIGWSEMFLVAVVAIIVVGPKDLPKMLRTIGKTIGNLKRMAGDFQNQFDDALKEADLDEVKKLAKGEFAPLEDIKKATSEFDNDFRKTMADRDAELKRAADNGEEVPLFPENETSKLLAEKRVKDVARKQAAAEKVKAKTTSIKKPVAKKTTTRNTAVKKTAVTDTSVKKVVTKKSAKPAKKAAKGKTL